MTDDEPTCTAAEREILDEVASSRGGAWAEEHAGPILAQARLVGDP